MLNPSNWISVPVAMTLIPLFSAPIVLALHRKPGIGKAIPLVATLSVALLTLSLIPRVAEGPVENAYSQFMALGLSFRVDPLSLVFLLLFSFLAVLISLFSVAYVDKEGSPHRFLTFMLLTFSGALGVLVAGDFLTLLLFFELMTLSSYVLVVHREDRDALRAGTTYLYLGIIAGLLVLLAIILLYAKTGGLEFTSALASLEGSGYFLPILALFTVGFGLKAGIAPLHVWMPGAYSVSPAPVNAISSGLMIKTGVYGMIRVYTSVLSYPGDGGIYTDSILRSGMLLIWIGVGTMLFGAIVALLQDTIMRTLAYSSVSQIGYIVMGLGVAVYLGSEGAMGLTGSLYHVINHSFFKATLFLTVGAIYFATGDLRLDRLGGLRKSHPMLMLIFLVAALGIGGMPGLNGYASKTILHHAIVEAYGHHQAGYLWLAEWLFTLTSAITVCYIGNLFARIFLGQQWGNRGKVSGNMRILGIPLGILAIVTLIIGVRPHMLLERLLLPLLSPLGYTAYAIDYVAHVNVWSVSDLLSAGKVFALAGIIYFINSRVHLEKLAFPSWLCIDSMTHWPAVHIDMPTWLCLDTITPRPTEESNLPSWLNVETLLYRPIVTLATIPILIPTALERVMSDLYHVIMGGKSISILKKYLPERSSEWDLQNVNLDALIVIGTITGLLLFLIVYFIL